MTALIPAAQLATERGPQPVEAASSPARRRICLIVESCGGGTGRHVLDLAQGLDAAGDKVTLIYCPERAEPHFLRRLAGLSTIQRHALTMRRHPGPGDLLRAWRLSRLIARLGPFDIVHSHSTKAGILARISPVGRARRYHTPHAAPGMDPTRSRLVARVFDLVERLLALRCARVIAVSHAEAAHLRAAGISQRRLATVTNGVAPELSPSRPSGPADAAGPHVFGFVGRLVPQKGADRLIRAFAGLQHGAAAQPPRLVIIGDGPDLRPLRAQAAALGLSRRIAFVGHAEAALWFRHFDTLMLPSRYEAMPYVLLEAESAGCPIIATDVAGSAEVVADNGLIVPNDDDPKALAAAMTRCLDPARHRDMRAAAELRRGRHGIETMIAGTRDAYASDLILFTPKESAVHRMHLDAVQTLAGENGLPAQRAGLRGVLRLGRGDRLFVQATGLANLIALPAARIRGAQIVLYLHEPTTLRRKLAENPKLKALIWHGVQKFECRLAHRILVSRPELHAEATGRFAPAARLAVAPLLMPRVEPPDCHRDRILYLGRPDQRRFLTEFAALAPALVQRGYRPTLLTGDPATLQRLLKDPSPAFEIIAEPDFSEGRKTALLAETLCLWNPKRGPIAQSGVTADAVRHGVSILLTDRDPAFALLRAAGIALDYDAENAAGFAGLDRIVPADVSAQAADLFDTLHGAIAFRRDWLPWLA